VPGGRGAVDHGCIKCPNRHSTLCEKPLSKSTAIIPAGRQELCERVTAAPQVSFHYADMPGCGPTEAPEQGQYTLVTDDERGGAS
jgi:hypothetical protein